MTITIPDEFLLASRMTEQEMATELAVVMYRRGVPLIPAAEAAGMTSRHFAHLLASRDIPVAEEYFRADATAAAGGVR
jgi:predicted HTH domain antitoxin